MKNMYQVVLIAASASVLVACGSSGSGSGASPVVPPVVPTTVTKAPGVASLANGKYTYTAANGKVYDFTMSGITSNNLTYVSKNSTVGSLVAGSDASFLIGGTAYSYMRFGAYASTDGKLDTFVAGTATPSVAVPTTGTAIYTGLAARSAGVNQGGSATMVFNVDYGKKTISGTGSTPSTAFGSALSLNGALSGATFSGKATSGTASGTFKGGFYGPAAQELAGTASFSDVKLDAVFGGKK